MDAVVTYIRSLRPAKPSVGDLLVAPDGTQREVTRRVDHCTGSMSIKVSNPDHWVLNAEWFIRFHRLQIIKNGETE